MAALGHSDRVSFISLAVTSSLMEKLSTIKEPFSEVQEIVLLSEDNVQLTLPSTFRWGPHLRSLHSTRIAFPSFPQLLLPSQNLVDLQLREIPRDGYFAPEAFVDVLSGMTQLRSISLHFLSLPPRRNYLRLPPPSGGRVVLPALASLKYQGTSKYLDCLVARIDPPRLADIDIIFFSQPTIDALQLGRFINRIDILKSPIRANIRASERFVNISFSDSSTFTPLRLQISCKRLGWQLSAMTQVCDRFSLFLHHVEEVDISITQPSSEQDDMDGGQWPGLLRSFCGIRDLRVAGDLWTDILLCALRPACGGQTIFLPSLRCLHIGRWMQLDGPLWDAVKSFIISRWLSGHPIQVDAPRYFCHICRGNFAEQQDIKVHLTDNHTYGMVCPYCDDIELSFGSDGLFQEHVASEHSKVVGNGKLFLDHSLQLASLSKMKHLIRVNRPSLQHPPDAGALPGEKRSFLTPPSPTRPHWLESLISEPWPPLNLGLKAPSPI